MSILIPREWQEHYQGSGVVSAKGALMRRKKKIGQAIKYYRRLPTKRW